MRFDQALQQAGECQPRSLAQTSSRWTCRALPDYLAGHGHRQVSDETIRRHLHALGYAILRPVLSIRSPDERYAEKVEMLHTHLAAANRGEVVLLFEDDVDLHLLPGITGCWTKRGTQRKVLTPGVNRKRHGFGAVHACTGVLTRLIRERKNSESFCTLVERIVEAYCPGAQCHGPKVVLVVDNFITHCSKMTSKLIGRYADRREVCEVPTYAPCTYQLLVQ